MRGEALKLDLVQQNHSGEKRLSAMTTDTIMAVGKTRVLINDSIIVDK